MISKVKRVTYYYCDFCKKRGGRVDAMTHHEERCTLNPSRDCGMCGAKSEDAKILYFMRDDNDPVYEWEDKAAAIESLKQRLHSCPACVLTVLRLNGYATDFTGVFNFKEEMKTWNEEQENIDHRATQF